MNNKIIVIEGACDGIGKSTQSDLLKQFFIENKYEVNFHHFPTYNSIQGSLVEEYLKGNLGNKETLSPYLINSIYAIDRAITWNKELSKKYKDNTIFLFDRYTTSSLIYQSTFIENIEEKKQFIDYVIDFEYKKIGVKKPDYVFFLKAPFDLVLELKNNRKENDGIKNDIHERDIEFMKKVYNNALFVADYLNWYKIECSYNGKMKTPMEINNEIRNIIKKEI